ncbi:hypothetical protein [Rhodospirillum centenum]|uniref:ParE-like toxin domain-containing protein n=1 Tax=Rhodospirillum centenum (strain ATCC 51521 / SW) TaxID=414684 RepID=B6ITN9_RHOCS|nr:hypothetical protein [Rhodospirillum centenum]ACI99340.1 conserved hypothetical protein [Rhodospirillum centenum SW]
MKSQTTIDFWACYAGLPREVKRTPVRAYRLWRENPRHPGLHFKCVNVDAAVYAVRIGIHWRALGIVDGDTVTWFWIGSHADYDRLLS